MSRLDAGARRLLELREANALAQARAKEAKEALDLYEAQFWSELEDLGVSSFNIELGEASEEYRRRRLAEGRSAASQALQAASDGDLNEAARLADRAADEFRAAGLGGRYGHGFRLERRERKDARIIDLEAFVRWAKENGLARELLKDTERKKVVNQFVRTRLENGEGLPPGMDFATNRYIGVTKRRSG